MDKINYSDYIDVIENIEEIQDKITPPKYRRCCYSFLEVCKIMLEYFKYNHKNK